MGTTLAPPPPREGMDAGMELSDDELEAVVGGLARVHLPGTVISSVQAPA
jgi:hypothetical protein